MPRVASVVLVLLALVVAPGGCIEKRRGSAKAAAKAKPAAQGPSSAVIAPDDVDDSLSSLVEGERVRATYAATDPWTGAAEPLVTIVEFSDFECPFCGRLAETLASVAARYPDDVRLVFKQF